MKILEQFSKTNEYLVEKGLEPIDWNLDQLHKAKFYLIYSFDFELKNILTTLYKLFD